MSKLRLPLFITRHVLFALLIGGFAGIGFVLFLTEFDHITSTETFCTTCHSMELVAEPYRQSSHYRPASGVQASCGDCHVSEGVFAATWDHFIGGKDLFNQLFGADYDDPVINALHLPDAAFAAREWFKQRDSATCKRCHVKEAIYGTRPDTVLIHTEDAKEKSCIECHYNLVHRAVPDKAVFKRDKWNRMIEEEFGLSPGEADKLLGGD
ncbi:MAG: NapC/NirT family cytochrome c [Candidatus Thiodiazotropha lotti]|uniref:Cytochrome C n=1 Tax=Candidatus Thiodiazotropha endoloripes TaxID=1818881 RepID=A0A1E2UUB6_9GAMM|nr:NapC/NirT family cytochrome c [Candidatus Thiodiazotropha endoloripes]MCG7899973.1 NapC/NirT family cytochrome c [Candidatus Thiodiazotropha weberae]MCG7993214.1 NapC/NirT family cytochrome c [Candidatus Thiodiazotropha lotti]MCG8001650.1 NapC/NirT family cytochrome c [Candidatus Thiodiazotropha lotti]MCW4184876.1 NapC/NirT family cytochrome c [Candidatus Thiodiazotropha weberae]MCW4193424.1 NapC/NirT family cytochrome c [Candidatus Thiodiazotropha weberae]